jgi:hypothetical protein
VRQPQLWWCQHEKSKVSQPPICLFGHEFLTFQSPKQYSQVMMSGDTVTPDLKWYEEVTKRKGLKEPRCPFASVEKCPRYYQSLSLLGSAGATAIDEREDEKLHKKWEHHHLWPKTSEQATSIGSREDKPHIYSRFCPEVSHEAFGLFADFLARYTDERDAELASERLGETGARSNDWRWSWQQVTPMHYADCPLYSPLLHDASNLAEKKWWERPAGIVALGILVTVIGGLILWGVTHHYDKPTQSTSAAQPTTPPQPQAAQPESKPQENTQPQSTHQRSGAEKKFKIEQHGEGNGAVGGSITTGPCSNVQVGGSNNTATTNCRPPQRTISEPDKKEMISVLSMYPNKTRLQFGALGSDPASESYRFAKSLRDIFDSSGWPVPDKGIAPMFNSGEPELSMVFRVPPLPAAQTPPPQATFVALCLKRYAHVKSITSNKRTDWDDSLTIIVGPNPAN